MGRLETLGAMVKNFPILVPPIFILCPRFCPRFFLKCPRFFSPRSAAFWRVLKSERIVQNQNRKTGFWASFLPAAGGFSSRLAAPLPAFGGRCCPLSTIGRRSGVCFREGSYTKLLDVGAGAGDFCRSCGIRLGLLLLHDRQGLLTVEGGTSY